MRRTCTSRACDNSHAPTYKHYMATFYCTMRKLLVGLEGELCGRYSGAHRQRDEHLDVLKDIFARVRQAGLTLWPSKCLIGYRNIGYVGQVIGKAKLSWKPRSWIRSGMLHSLRPCSRRSDRSLVYTELRGSRCTSDIPHQEMTAKRREMGSTTRECLQDAAQSAYSSSYLALTWLLPPIHSPDIRIRCGCG
jgi:hypothetical protein